MFDLTMLSESLDRNRFTFLLNVETFKPSDKTTFTKIEQEASDIARALKDKDLLPRPVLKNIYRAIGVIRAQIPRQKEWQGELEDMSNRLEYIFGLILAGESPDGRTPGVPRII